MVGNKKVVALCTSRIYDLQVHSYIVALNEQLSRQGFALWIYSLNEDLYWEEDKCPAEASIFGYIAYDLVDVVIVMDEKIKSHRIAQGIIDEARVHDKPVVILDGSYEGCASGRFDFEKGFEAVVRHVVEEHHVNHPHFMAGFQGNAFSDERIAVFRRVIKENGISFDERMVSYGNFWALPAREAMQAVIDSGEIPDAVICANDIMAINVCDVLKKAGYAVPGDVLVTGFDGCDEAFLNLPGVTTADCELAGLADMTIKAIESCLTGETDKTFLVVPRLIPNESCGCPRYTDLRKLTMSRFNTGFYRYQDDIRLLHEAVTGMLASRTLPQAVSCLKGKYTGHMCCVVKESCFIQEHNFFMEDETESGYSLVYDPDYPQLCMHSFELQEVVPGLERRMENGYPIAFQALDYMDHPMGYVAYFFQTDDITEYARTANITETVNMGLGSFINMQYQRYLLARVGEMYQKDALTGLYNRLAFREAFEEMKNAPEQDGRDLLVVMADLDYLKKINDGIGHKAGDQAIAAVANALQRACPEDALCVRFGGDEMLAFLPGGGEAEKILAKIDVLLKEKSREIGFPISASCGSYTTRITREMNLQEIVEKVDEKMYQVKKARKKNLSLIETKS